LLALKAEALHFAHRNSEVLGAIEEAVAFAEKFGARWWRAELQRLRGIFLATIRAGETQIEALCCVAIKDGERAKVHFAGNMGGSKLRGISLPDRESVREGSPFPHENSCGILK
jgi:hypothetical protein